MTLEGWKIFRFNLITGLKAVPYGTAAYVLQQGGGKISASGSLGEQE